jgi:hypothetical protein
VTKLVPRPWLIVGAVLLVAGILLAAIGDGKADVAGFGVGGAGAILLLGAAFYAVGRSEDLERERERERR